MKQEWSGTQQFSQIMWNIFIYLDGQVQIESQYIVDMFYYVSYWGNHR